MTAADKIESLRVDHERLQVGLRPNQICMGEGIVLDVHEDSKYGFEFFRWRSPQMVDELNWFINLADGKKTFLDVGAFDGVFSLVFAKLNPQSVTYAIEPAHEPNCRLLYNATNQGNIIAYKAALSDYSGDMKMTTEWEHLAESENGEFLVPCFTGDELLKNEKLDIAKIDVEGMEIKVLKGLNETIKRDKPIIFLEIHINKIRNEIHELISMIDNWGYKIIDTENGEETRITQDETIDKRLILMP